MRTFFILIFFIFNFTSFAYINIFPVEFNKDITKGATEEFFLYNRTENTKKYRIYVEDTPEKPSMTDWIEVYPKSITLKPQEQKSLRIYVEAPSDIKAGNFYSTIVFKEINIPKIYQDTKPNNKLYNIMTILKLKIKGSVNR